MPASDVRHVVVAGAQRSGTSYLARELDRHPAVAFAKPFRPEPKFFLRDTSSCATCEDYRRIFGGDAAMATVLGEKSTSYMDRPEAPARIARLLPDARLVFVLRDPVERAISNYWFSVESRVETASMDDAFRTEAERRDRFDPARFSTSPFAYLERGRYVEHLTRFEEHFPRDRMTLVLFEDLVADPASAVGWLLTELGLEPSLASAADHRPLNSAPRRGARPSSELRRFLARRFDEPNRRLAARYGLDLARWTPSVPVKAEA